MVFDAYVTPGSERETLLPAQQLLESMDRAGVARALIAPDDREIALTNEVGNQRIAEMARQSGGRLVAACTVNPWHGNQAQSLVHDAVKEGARMLVLSPLLQGFSPCDDLLDPLLDATAEHQLPVYLHTGPHSHGAPTQVLLLASRRPDARFILGHCGSTDYAWDMPAILKTAPPNLWFELSFVRPWAMPQYAQQTDEARLIFASSAPRNDMGFELGQFDRAWPIAEHPGMYGLNMARLIEEVRA